MHFKLHVFSVIITEFLCVEITCRIIILTYQKVMKRAWCVGGDLTTPTSPVATPIIVCLWTWCNDYNTATMLIAIPVCSLFLFMVCNLFL